jgi:hypothetical protein
MGLLDDAIREHLELKRRHGADPSEVQRQEHEALGPARRGVAPAAEAAPLPVGAAGEEDEPEVVPYDDDEPGDEEPDVSVPVGEPEAPVAPPAPEDAAPDLEVDDEDEAPDLGVDDADRPSPREDVLEETPDFLQETPEHDRLWFEQKPPRDFEF